MAKTMQPANRRSASKRPHKAKPIPTDYPEGGVKFYRNKRIIRPLLASIGAVFVTHDPFVGFLAYVLAGLFLDWLFFTQNEYKDSDQLPEACFQEMGVTGKQVDQRNDFMVAVRRGACATSVSAASACVLFDTSLSWQVAFVMAYIGVTFVSVITALSRGKVVSLLRYDSDGELVESAYPLSIIDTPYYDATSDDTINNPYA